MTEEDGKDRKRGLEENMEGQPGAGEIAKFLDRELEEERIWFSHGYEEKDVKDMKKLDAEISLVNYTEKVPKPLILNLDIKEPRGGTASLQLDGEDVNELMARTYSDDYADLEGNEVEVYVDGGEIKTISVPLSRPQYDKGNPPLPRPNPNEFTTAMELLQKPQLPEKVDAGLGKWFLGEYDEGDIEEMGTRYAVVRKVQHKDGERELELLVDGIDGGVKCLLDQTELDQIGMRTGTGSAENRFLKTYWQDRELKTLSVATEFY